MLYATAPEMSDVPYRRALELNPRAVLAAEAHVGLGNYQYFMGSYGLAAKEFEIATRLDPISANALFLLGISHARNKNMVEARRAHGQLLTRNTAMATDLLKTINEEAKNP